MEHPAFLYGTAWKENETKRLVALALEQGFRGIDTANQRKHYHEAGVGEALREAFAAKKVKRDELFVQTKFTHQDGQDHRLPYDPNASVRDQVHQSVASSLDHLPIGVIDSYVLHGPSTREGLAPEDLEAWDAMEEVHAQGKARLLGASNVSRSQLELLLRHARVKPAFVQNRCYAVRGWDRATRALCKEHGIVYQGFSLLTANRRELELPELRAIAKRAKLTPQQVVFSFALRVGMLPLTGTTSATHMKEDLAVTGTELTDAEVEKLESISG